MRSTQGEGSRVESPLSLVSATPRLDAELLLAHALGIAREALLLGDHAIPPAFETLIQRRLAHEPIAYITGRRAFWTIELDVTPAVLIPRPDSETLIEAAVAHFGDAAPGRVLDLGTGSGALLLAALDQWLEATGVGIDASADALAVAEANAARIAPGRAEMRLGDWAGTGAAFDLILCNPPYVETGAVLSRDVANWEPASALFAGADGLDDYRMIAPVLAPQLAPGGIACIEIGAGQAERVSALFAAEGFAVAARNDLAGITRCLTLTRK